MPTGIEIGQTTIHRIVEQEGPFFEALKFFPTRNLRLDLRATGRIEGI